jgi:predicted porin
MKKLLLASLLTLGFATAQAQSSVNVYGVLDVGYIGGNYQGIAGNPKSSQTFNTIGQSAQQTSRLGFRGTEDLGGGRSAFYTVETQINPVNGTISAWNTRQSFVGLQDNALGKFAVGTMYTMVDQAVTKTDPGNKNDMIGSVIAVQNLQSYGNPGSAPFAQASSSSGTSDAYTVRTTNTVQVSSLEYSGFQANAMYVANNTNTTQTSAITGGTANFNGWGVNANYTYNKFFGTLAYQALKSQITGTVTTPVPAAWTAPAGGANTQDNQTFAGATYDFGIVKGYAQWLNRKVTGTVNSALYANRTAQNIGVRGYFTPVVEGWAMVGNGNVKYFGAGAPTANFTAFQLGSNYYLSKRTNLYAIYGQNKTTSTTGALGTPALSANNYAVGVRHTF